MDTPRIVDSTTLADGVSITLTGITGDVTITNTDGKAAVTTTIPTNNRTGGIEDTYTPSSVALIIRWFANADHSATAGINLSAGNDGIMVEWTEGLEKKE